MKQEDKPFTTAQSTGEETPNLFLNKLFETVKKISDAHDLGIVMFANLPTSEIAVIEGKPRRKNESALLIHNMDEQRAYVFGQAISKAGGVADAAAIGWRDSVLKNPVNQNTEAQPTVAVLSDDAVTVH